MNNHFHHQKEVFPISDEIAVVLDEKTKASFSEKNLSNYEQKYNKGTRKAIPDIIKHGSVATDYDFHESTKKEVGNVSEKKKRTSNAPTRLANIVGKRGILKNFLGIREFGKKGILGKFKNRVIGQGTDNLEQPKLLTGKFLDGSIKEAITAWIFSKSGVGVTQSSEEQKETRDKSKRGENIAIVHHPERHDTKGLSVSW